MRSARPFLAAIRESPDDDTSRLVFADWLDERGESARAEFIRVQCELAKLPTFSPRYPGLHLRQLELLAEHEAEWLGEWADRLVRWEFRRGLLHSITLTPQPFVTWGEHLFVDHPVERVALVDDEGESLAAEEVARVVAARAMGEVRALETAGCRRGEPLCGMYGGIVATSAWLSALARAEHVTRLEELHLNGDTRSGRRAIELAAWRQFCQAPHLRTLRRLDLSDVYRNDLFQNLIGVVRVLRGASFVGHLRTLSFAGCYLGDDAAQELAASPLVGLEDMDLARCEVLGADGLGAVLSSPSLSRLRALGVPYAVNLEDLAGAPLLAQLHALRLQGDTRGGSTVRVGNWSARLGRRVADHEWESLFHSPHLHNLTSLTVGAYRGIPPEAIRALLQAPWSANLQELNLNCGDSLSMEHVAPLFARPVQGPTPLHRLSIPDCAGIGHALARWPGLAGITDLNLTRVYDQECEEDTSELLRSAHLSHRLARLDLSASCQTQDNVEQLAGCPALAGLRWLGFGRNQLNSDKMKVLLQSPHLRNVEALHLWSEYFEDETTTVEALSQLAKSHDWPRLRDVVVGSGTPVEGIAVLRERFGPRLRVWADC
jgi:uncharacterized protein (TIGR02996 family)